MSYLSGFKLTSVMTTQYTATIWKLFIMHGRYKPVVRLDLAVGCVPMRLFPINLSFLEVGSRPEYLPNVIIAERRLACVFTFLLNELLIALIPGVKSYTFSISCSTICMQIVDLQLKCLEQGVAVFFGLVL